MNYQAYYDRLIRRAKLRVLPSNVYREVHHIQPRALGGGDEKENLVELTAPEHYVAHLVLYRIHRGFSKKQDTLLLFPVICMTAKLSLKGLSKNKAYAWAKEEFRKNCCGKNGRIPWNKGGGKYSLESRIKMSNSHKGHKTGMRGKRHSESAREKMSQAKIGVHPWNYGMQPTPEMTFKSSQGARRGKFIRDTVRAAQRLFDLKEEDFSCKIYSGFSKRPRFSVFSADSALFPAMIEGYCGV